MANRTDLHDGSCRETSIVPAMPLFLDRHDAPGATAAEVAALHALDMSLQDSYGVRYVTYWFDESGGKVFCLAEGPDRAALEAVHREAHGLVAEDIIEVGYGPINAFLGPIPQYPAGEAYIDPAVRAILFTDMCGSTEQTQELGDQGHVAILREHDDIVRVELTTHGGREIKHTGDGIMASFRSVVSAVDCAISIQRILAGRNRDAAVVLQVRIGISAGEPVADHDDLFGAAVQLAARLCSIAEPGGVAVSTAVRELCIGKRLEFDCAGPIALKGFAEPVQVHQVIWQ
jgi:class 3 adenylate cyclase